MKKLLGIVICSFGTIWVGDKCPATTNSTMLAARIKQDIRTALVVVHTAATQFVLKKGRIVISQSFLPAPRSERAKMSSWDKGNFKFQKTKKAERSKWHHSDTVSTQRSQR